MPVGRLHKQPLRQALERIARDEEQRGREPAVRSHDIHLVGEPLVEQMVAHPEAG